MSNLQPLIDRLQVALDQLENRILISQSSDDRVHAITPEHLEKTTSLIDQMIDRLHTLAVHLKP